MKPIWAPWRLEYIRQSKQQTRSGEKRRRCLFCDIQKGRPGAGNLVLFKGERIYVVMNRYPYNNGHLMVLPKRHINNYARLTEPEHAEMGVLIGQAIDILKTVYQPQGFNVGLNLGEAGGAGIREHLHYHVVPRWKGDTNFMPVVAGVRVMVEHLKESYWKLRSEFRKL